MRSGEREIRGETPLPSPAAGYQTVFILQMGLQKSPSLVALSFLDPFLAIDPNVWNRGRVCASACSSFVSPTTRGDRSIARPPREGGSPTSEQVAVCRRWS